MRFSKVLLLTTLATAFVVGSGQIIGASDTDITTAPTEAPTVAPTAAPTDAPTLVPTAAPTEAPTLVPTAAPTALPTMQPTSAQPNGRNCSMQNSQQNSCLYRADFVGQSGQVKFFPCTNSNKFIKIKMNGLEEYPASSSNGNGKANGKACNSVSSFASQDFTWNGPIYTTLNGSPCTMVTFSSQLAVNGGMVPFNMTTYMVGSSTNVPYGSGSITLDPMSMMFSISMGPWPFASKANSLRFSFQVLSSGGSGVTSSTGASASTFQFGDGAIMFPTTVISDGATSSGVSSTSTQNGNNNVADMTFSSFSRSLQYNAVMTFPSSATTAASSSSSSTVSGNSGNSHSASKRSLDGVSTEDASVASGTTTSNGINGAAIAGGAIGLCAVAAVSLFVVKKRRAAKEPENTNDAYIRFA